MCDGVNTANVCVQRGQQEKRRWPVQVNEFKTPSAELGSKETPTQGPCHGARESEFMARNGSHHFSVAAGVLGSNETPGRTNSWREVLHTSSALPLQM